MSKTVSNAVVNVIKGSVVAPIGGFMANAAATTGSYYLEEQAQEKEEAKEEEAKKANPVPQFLIYEAEQSARTAEHKQQKSYFTAEQQDQVEDFKNQLPKQCNMINKKMSLSLITAKTNG